MLRALMLSLFLAVSGWPESFDVKQPATFRRLKSHLNSVPAIDTHDHLKPFAILQGPVHTERGMGMTLCSLWQSSYYTWIHRLAAWPESGRFDDWWPQAKLSFRNAHATSFYRYQLREDDARHIGAQVMRENALELFPQLKARLWKHK